MRKCCRCRGEAAPSAAASGDEMNGGEIDGEGGSGEEEVGDGRWRVGSGGGGRGAAAPGGEGMEPSRCSLPCERRAAVRVRSSKLLLPCEYALRN